MSPSARSPLPNLVFFVARATCTRLTLAKTVSRKIGAAVSRRSPEKGAHGEFRYRDRHCGRQHHRRLLSAGGAPRSARSALRVPHHLRRLARRVHRLQPLRDHQRLRQGFIEAVTDKVPKPRDFLDVLSVLHALMRELRAKSRSEVEAHFDNPKESEIFKAFPKLLPTPSLSPSSAIIAASSSSATPRPTRSKR